MTEKELDNIDNIEEEVLEDCNNGLALKFIPD